jgi:hypothetical protein
MKIPRSDAGQREALHQAAELLAKVLDTAIRIPGTSLTIGLDPLIGLIPGIGDAVANLIGSTLLLLGAQLQVPRIVLARMSLNLVINAVIGAVPVAGDLFSVWFRSHARNAALLRQHTTPVARSSTSRDWVFVISILIATIALILGTMATMIWLVARLWKLVQ